MAARPKGQRTSSTGTEIVDAAKKKPVHASCQYSKDFARATVVLMMTATESARQLHYSGPWTTTMRRCDTDPCEKPSTYGSPIQAGHSKWQSSIERASLGARAAGMQLYSLSGEEALRVDSMESPHCNGCRSGWRRGAAAQHRVRRCVHIERGAA